MYREASEIIWSFETKNYRVEFEAIPETPDDLSFDEDNQIAKALDDGKLVCFTAHMIVTHIPTGAVLGEDYLGSCIYESAESFIDHRGIKHYRPYDGAEEGMCGSYFSDMVSEAIHAARENAPKYAFHLKVA